MAFSKNIQPNWLYFLIVVLSGLWCALFSGVPLFLKGPVLLQKASVWIYYFFSGICHQIPERSLQCQGFPMAVCSRCAGIYYGFFLTTILYPFIPIKLNSESTKSLYGLLFGIIIMGLEYIITKLGLMPLSHPARLITGWLVGIAGAFIILPMIHEIQKGRFFHGKHTE